LFNKNQFIVCSIKTNLLFVRLKPVYYRKRITIVAYSKKEGIFYSVN